jgi:hypothetical protein
MLKYWTLRILMVSLLAVGAAACDDEVPTSPTDPPDPSTETFSGTVTQNGAQTRSFATAASGTVTATLKEIGPGSDLTIGFSLGNWIEATSTCQIVLANDAATGGAILTGTVTNAGTLCIRMYDVGKIAATPAVYTVEVVHP